MLPDEAVRTMLARDVLSRCPMPVVRCVPTFFNVYMVSKL